MPPRKRADHLTEEQLGELSTALSEGRRATVYLVDGIPSLGIDPGTSGRVVSISGSTVMVRPKGVDDELPFESDELRTTRDVPAPAKRPAAKSSPAARNAPEKAAPRSSDAPRPQASRTPTPPPQAPKTPNRAPAAPRSEETSTVTQPQPTTAPAKPKPPARKPKKSPAISITVTIDPENEWTVGVAHGTRKIGKPAPVTPDAVERAVKELGDPAAVEAVQSVIEEARSAAEERVAQLSRELEQARKALESLGATPKTGSDL